MLKTHFDPVQEYEDLEQQHDSQLQYQRWDDFLTKNKESENKISAGWFANQQKNCSDIGKDEAIKKFKMRGKRWMTNMRD